MRIFILKCHTPNLPRILQILRSQTVPSSSKKSCPPSTFLMDFNEHHHAKEVSWVLTLTRHQKIKTFELMPRSKKRGSGIRKTMKDCE